MKVVIKSIILIFVLLVVAVVALVFWVDINRFKPVIQYAASERGIALQIGDVGWSLWPTLGVSLSEVSVAALASPDKPIAQVQEASLATALIPLLKGQLKVDNLLIDGANIYLSVDETGKGNWEAFSQQETPPEKNSPATPSSTQTPAASDKTSLNFEISRISIHDSALDYRDLKSGQNIHLSKLTLDVTDVNTQGNPFDLTLSWVLETVQSVSGEKMQLEGKLNNKTTLDKSFNNLRLDNGDLQLKLTAKSSVDIAAKYSLVVNNLQEKMAYEGSLDVEPINLRQLLVAMGTTLETADSEALKKFSLTTHVRGDTSQVELDSIQINMDKTSLTGTVAVSDFSTAAIKLALKGNSINLDDYLPPEDEPSGETETVTAAEDTPLPLEALRSLNLDAKVNLAGITIKKMALQNVDLHIKASNGVIEQRLTAGAYQGDIKFLGTLDARPQKAKLDFDGNLQGIELAPLLHDMKMDEQKMQLSGAIQMQARGTTQGASVNQLMEGMNTTASFSGAQIRLSPLNIEEQFCKLVNLVTRNNTEAITWDSFTEMRQLNGNIIWRDQVINLESFNAGVSQLLLASTGKINLANDKYEFKLPIKLTEASETATLRGCTLGTGNYWVGRGLSLLRCKGSFAAINPAKDCGFDKSALGDLTKDYAEYKLREKHGAKIDAAEQKLKDKRQELLDDANKKLGGEGTVTKPKDLLNNFLKKKLGENQSSSNQSSSAMSSSQ